MKQTEDFTLKKALIITMVFVFFVTLMPTMVFAEGNTNDKGKLPKNATKPENQVKKDITKEEIIERIKGIYSNMDEELKEEEENNELYYELSEEEVEFIEQGMPESELTTSIESKGINNFTDSKGKGNKKGYYWPKIISYRENYTIHMWFAGISYDGSNIQIWGKNNNNHFLIKDYGDTLPGYCSFTKFEWDITDGQRPINAVGNNIDDSNANNVVKEYDEDFDNIGIYVKVKNGRGNGRNLTYYENFSLVEKDEFKGANLITSFDSDKLMSDSNSQLLSRTNYNTQFPAVAIKGKSFQMKLIENLFECNMDYKVSIKGWNDGKEYEKELVGEYQNLNCKSYSWTPEYDGVFNIVVEDLNTGKSVIVRKVFVRSMINDGYLSIDNVNINDGDKDNIKIEVTADNYVQQGEENDPSNYSQLAVRVGEESVWSKTIKSYAEKINNATNDDNKVKITVSESNKNFELSKGQYFIDALVKKRYSVEYEDVVRKHYYQEAYEGLFKVIVKDSDGNIIVNPDEFIKGQYTFEIVFDESNDLAKDLTDDELNKLEYAFLIWDARGKRLIYDYAVNPVESINDNKVLKNTFKYTFRDPGEYKIYLRARVKKDNETMSRPKGDGITEPTWKLPNSYMDEVSMAVNIPMDNSNIEISQVKITSFNNNKADNKLFAKDQNQVYNVNPGNKKQIEINAHSKNIINISAGYIEYNNGNGGNKGNKGNNSKKNNRLMYKVYAIHDGIWECLTQYTVSNEIPFYPRSTGDYKLLILVKDSISGSEQDRLELNVKAE